MTQRGYIPSMEVAPGVGRGICGVWDFFGTRKEGCLAQGGREGALGCVGWPRIEAGGGGEWMMVIEAGSGVGGRCGDGAGRCGMSGPGRGQGAQGQESRPILNGVCGFRRSEGHPRVKPKSVLYISCTCTVQWKGSTVQGKSLSLLMVTVCTVIVSLSLESLQKGTTTNIVKTTNKIIRNFTVFLPTWPYQIVQYILLNPYNSARPQPLTTSVHRIPPIWYTYYYPSSQNEKIH